MGETASGGRDAGERAHELRDEARRLERASDAARLRNLRRRVSRARDFPANTCPASRHLHLIADTLAKGQPYHGCAWEGWDQQDREWIAETMLSVLESLWKLRTSRSDDHA